MKLETLFSPRSVAVIGASKTIGKLGYAVVANIVESGFDGAIYPINPQPGEILGRPCRPSLSDCPGPVDMAVIVIPAKGVLDALEECGAKGVGTVVVISAGFRETGHEGLLAERKMAEIAHRHNMRIIGPNCLGVIDTVVPMNASFATGMPRKGSIAFMSQSGALCTSILDIALERQIGFSRFISLGNKADMNELDFIEAWADDCESKVIMAYLEGIANGARFIESTRVITKEKPVIAIKSGTTSAGAKAVSSHTGTLAGSERAYEAAFKQSGVIRARSVGDLFDLAVAFARQPLPRNEKIAIITNAGGPGIMASDAIERAGLSLATLSAEAMDDLKKALPPAASVVNPVDVLGDALADRYEAALHIVSDDPGVGAIIVILTPQFMTEIPETARAVVDVSKRKGIPVLACFMGEAHIKEGVKILTEGNVPNYIIPDQAVAVLRAMVDQKNWRERPLPDFEHFDVDRAQVAKVFARTRADGRLQIGDAGAREILEAYKIPIPPSKVCKTTDEAVAFAEQIGYPVVVKIASPDILHKTDIGGVRLNVMGAQDVRDSFDLVTFRALRYMPDAEIWGCQVQKQVKGGKEVILGMNRDPQFGPLVMFGLGGIYVEVLKDVAFRVAPFSRREARELVREIKAYNLLKGVRGEPPCDIEAVVDILLKLSQLVTDFPEIVEMDINPLLAFPEGSGVLAIDMRLVLAAER